MNKGINIGDFSSSLFWDIDKTKLDIEQHRRFIIERTLTHGTLSDWFLIKNYYGKSVIKAECMQLRYLDKLTLAFCSAYFTAPVSHFRCYTHTQSHHSHWDY